MTRTFDLAGLLDPVTVQTFRSEHWERAPLAVQNRDASYYDDLLSARDVDHVLEHTSLRPPNVRIVRDGRDVTPDAGGANLAEGGLESIYQHYRDGSTIVLVFLHERWPPLRRLCRALARETSAAVQVNVYITPRGARGLAAHADEHDVLVLQTAGSKRWRLPGRELVLRPGDLLYVPRGHRHEAVSEDEFSVHLTVGVKPVRWADVLRASLESVVAADEALVGALPWGFATSAAARVEATSRLEAIVTGLPERLAADEAVAAAAGRARAHAPPALAGHLDDLEAEPALALDTPLRRRDEVECVVVVDSGRVTLEFHGKRLTLPAHAEEAVRFVACATAPFTARDLPGALDDDGGTVLLRRLLKEGFLTRPLVASAGPWPRPPTR